MKDACRNCGQPKASHTGTSLLCPTQRRKNWNDEEDAKRGIVRAPRTWLEPPWEWDEHADQRIQDAGGHLSEILMFRMGLMTEEEILAKMQAEPGQQIREDTIDLTPPITAEKITAALAAVTTRLLSGELEPAKGNAMLYAIQNLTGAHHAQVEEAKLALARERLTHNQQKQLTRGATPQGTGLPDKKQPAAKRPTRKRGHR